MGCKKNCNNCKGTGKADKYRSRITDPHEKETCTHCSGSGKVDGDHNYKSQGVRGNVETFRCSICGDTYTSTLDFER